MTKTRPQTQETTDRQPETEPTTQKPMTQVQVRYAVARVDVVAEHKKCAIRDDPSFVKYRSCSVLDAMWEEYLAGRYRIDPKSPRVRDIVADNHSAGFLTVLDYTSLPSESDRERAHQARYAASQARLDAVDAEATRVKDQLVLGDCQSALAALRAFEALAF